MEDSVRVRGENNQRQRRFREKQLEFFLKVCHGFEVAVSVYCIAYLYV